MEMVETFWENHGNYNCLMWKHVEAHLPFLSSHLAPNPRVALCLPTSPQSQRWHSETYGYSGSWPCGCQQNRSAYYIKTYQDCQDSWWKCKEVIYDIYVICTVICSYYDLLWENCEIGRRFGIPKCRQRSIGSKGSNPNNCWTPPFDSETKAAENHKMGHNLPGHPPGIAKHQENISQKTYENMTPKHPEAQVGSKMIDVKWFSMVFDIHFRWESTCIDFLSPWPSPKLLAWWTVKMSNFFLKRSLPAAWSLQRISKQDTFAATPPLFFLLQIPLWKISTRYI